MDRYQVALASLPGEQIAFIKTLRIIGKLSLADATRVHAYANACPRTVLVAGIDRDVADHIARHFAEAGIAVIVQASSLTTPMTCAPEANTAYRWRPWRMGFARANPT